MAFSFYGGVHPKANKQYAENMPVVPFPEPDMVTIPMQQHIGAPCTPLVKKGNYVRRGQKIGDGAGLCVPVHASVSGCVRAVELRPGQTGMDTMSVVIESDHQDALCDTVVPRTQAEADALTPEALMQIIREAGIVGMGGAAFPTYAKLASAVGKADTLIVNASECEPYIVADDRVCREYPRAVLSGARLAGRVLGISAVHLALEENKPAAAAAIREVLPEFPEITLDILPAKYPQGAEKQLIQAVTGRQVPPGALPAAVGCVVLNAGTCKAISDAVYLGMPLICRIVTVSGDIVASPGNFLVPIGTGYDTLLAHVGLRETPYKVLSGGPMMGVTQHDLRVPAVKGTNAVTALGKNKRFAVENPHCIRCGRCVAACPMHLMPLFLYQGAAARDLQKLEALHMTDCIECGCCAYVCPAGIPLVQAFRAAKQRLRDAKAGQGR